MEISISVMHIWAESLRCIWTINRYYGIDAYILDKILGFIVKFSYDGILGYANLSLY